MLLIRQRLYALPAQPMTAAGTKKPQSAEDKEPQNPASKLNSAQGAVAASPAQVEAEPAEAPQVDSESAGDDYSEEQQPTPGQIIARQAAGAAASAAAGVAGRAAGGVATSTAGKAFRRVGSVLKNGWSRLKSSGLGKKLAGGVVGKAVRGFAGLSGLGKAAVIGGGVLAAAGLTYGAIKAIKHFKQKRAERLAAQQGYNYGQPMPAQLARPAYAPSAMVS